MMKFEDKIQKVLDEATKRCDAAEVIGFDRKGKVLFIANGGHPDLKSFDVGEVALRVVKDGQLGSAVGSIGTPPATGTCSRPR